MPCFMASLAVFGLQDAIQFCQICFFSLPLDLLANLAATDNTNVEVMALISFTGCKTLMHRNLVSHKSAMCKCQDDYCSPILALS